MSLSSSFNAAVSGLAGNASSLGVISDNLANSSTNGYKAAEIEFNAQVISQGKRRYSAGGVRTEVTRDLSQEAAYTATDRPGDVAISGDGFIAVRPYVSAEQVYSSNETYFTTTGSFVPNANGILTTNTGLSLLGWKVDDTGELGNVSRTSVDDLEPVKIDMNETLAQPTSRIEIGANLPSSHDGATPYYMILEHYDQFGASVDIVAEFQPDPNIANTWTLNLNDEAGLTLNSYELKFGDKEPTNGKLEAVTVLAGAGGYDDASGNLVINAGHGNIDLNIGRLGAEGQVTQFASSFSPVKIQQNGSPASRLSSYEITNTGEVVGYYDSGISRTLYHIPLADMPNPNGMEMRDNQTYALTSQAGQVFFWESGTSGVGVIQSGVLEQSTTDVATELTNMIKTQRAYSSNAKVIQTVDDMLQETTNIKR